MENDFAKIEAALGVQIADKELLQRALTHRSILGDDADLVRQDHNERLEFLGDAVLGLIAAQELFAQIPHGDEGLLTQLRAAYVCEASLADAASRLNIAQFMRVSKSMRASGPLSTPSVLADAMEALIAAVYLDQGFAAAREFVLRVMGPVPLKLTAVPKDSKTELQEIVQAHLSLTPTYRVKRSFGPPHAPTFEVELMVGDVVLSVGEGPSKKEAAQEAARLALLQTQQWDKGRFEQLIGRNR